MKFWKRLRWISLAVFAALLLFFALQGGESSSPSAPRSVPTFHN